MKLKEIVNLSGEKLNYMEPSKTNLYTIPKGTILYHGTLYKESFNPFDIRLGEDNKPLKKSNKNNREINKICLAFVGRYSSLQIREFLQKTRRFCCSSSLSKRYSLKE